jgi:hypothetical protein
MLELGGQHDGDEAGDHYKICYKKFVSLVYTRTKHG